MFKEPQFLCTLLQETETVEVILKVTISGKERTPFFPA